MVVSGYPMLAMKAQQSEYANVAAILLTSYAQLVNRKILIR